MAVRISLGLCLGFLGILLFGVAGANAADLPVGQHSSSNADHAAPMSGHGNGSSGNPGLVERTVEAATELVGESASAVVDDVDSTTEKVLPAKRTSTNAKKSDPGTVAAAQKSVEESPSQKPAAQKEPKPAAQETQRQAVAQDNGEPSAEARSQKRAKALQETATKAAQELEQSAAALASSKSTETPAREATETSSTKIQKTTAEPAHRTADASTQPSHQPIRKTISHVTDAVEKPAKADRNGSGTPVGDLSERIVDEVDALPSTLAEPPVKETVATVTKTVDNAVAKTPVANEVLTDQALTRTTKPVADLADDTVDAVVTPVVRPVAKAAEPGVRQLTDVVRPALGTVAGSIDPMVAPVVEVVNPALGTIADTVDPVLAPVSKIVSPVVDTFDNEIERPLPVLGLLDTGTAKSTQASSAPMPGEDQKSTRGGTPAATTTATSNLDRLTAAAGTSAITTMEATFQTPSAQLASVAGTDVPAAASAGHTDSDAPQPMPAPLSVQGSGASFGNGSGPLMPLGAIQGSPLNIVLHSVSEPTSETSHQGPRGSSNDPGSTPD